jgi:hypothetical protein
MAASRYPELRHEFPGFVRACLDNFVAIAGSRTFLAALAFVALVEGVLLGLALATVYAGSEGIEMPTWFYLDAEFSFGEIWEYCLTAAAAAGLLLRYTRLREPIIGCLGLVFVWLTLDNALALHEAMGHTISPLFMFAENSQTNLNDYGELFTFVLIGSAILLALFINARKSRMDSVIQSLAIIGMLGGAACFGVLFDFVDHALAGDSPLTKGVFSVIKDGSKMILLSIATVIAITSRPPAHQD